MNITLQDINNDWYLLKRKIFDIEKISTFWLFNILDDTNNMYSTYPLDKHNPMICPGQFFYLEYNKFSTLDIHKKWISGFIIGKDKDYLQIINFNYFTKQDKYNIIRMYSIDNSSTWNSNINKDVPDSYPFDFSSLVSRLVNEAYPHCFCKIEINKIDRIKLIKPFGMPLFAFADTNLLLNGGNQNIKYTEQVILNLRSFQAKKTIDQRIKFANERLSNTIDEIDKISNDKDIELLKKQYLEIQLRLSLFGIQK